MKRYIDVEKLTHRIMDTDYINTACEVLIEIDCMPKEDVAPVVHAHWFESYWDGTGAECSNCSCVIHAYDIEYQEVKHDFEYCPYCGAKMDEGVQQ